MAGFSPAALAANLVITIRCSPDSKSASWIPLCYHSRPIFVRLSTSSRFDGTFQQGFRANPP